MTDARSESSGEDALSGAGAETMSHPRYDALAKVLMDAPDPVRAIAALLGDHEARLDIAMERIHHLECAAGGEQKRRG